MCVCVCSFFMCHFTNFCFSVIYYCLYMIVNVNVIYYVHVCEQAR